ncbi:L7Ae/L30e/S12e/Gadd45 family ribosomal protein [Abyssisolibacter fermentans]|uniref:L7Ae/L30e/S12e/Gadd45 family ribosomal protein n=1 Tax=Abyssisolibacter fermentans TaxID=1766203 RepID=UPI0008360D01|nr:ribosomal L7Ae/L30e/S12e/Gadd45 family protein [Abyssisolibacter fermentans]
MNNKFYSMLGIGKKAGYIKAGETPCVDSIKKGKGYLLIIAEDASDNTKKKFTNLSDKNNLSYHIVGSKELIGRSIGKELISTIVVCNKQFSSVLEDLL